MNDPTPRTVDSLSRGETLPPFSLAIEHDDVRVYLEATGEPPERWSERVPPLMLVALMIGGLMERVAVPDRLLHTGQEFEMHRALHIGEPVEVRLTVASHAVRQGALTAAFDFEAFAGDEPVASARASVIVPPEAAAEDAP